MQHRVYSEEPWLDLPNFAGVIQFLPAFPWREDPGIELDVVTPHHTAYYECILRRPQTRKSLLPACFLLSVRLRSPFLFSPSVGSPTPSAEFVPTRDWLRDGLTLFGIGGKTAAGYGWFEKPELDTEVLHRSRARGPEKDGGRLRLEAEQKVGR